MICETCGRCTNIKLKDNRYEIGCLEKGIFQLHETNEPNFNCGDYAKAEPKPLPPKENVFIVLSGSGRDFMLYDRYVKNQNDIDRKVGDAYGVACGYVTLGDLVFKVDDIAVYGYIGE